MPYPIIWATDTFTGDLDGTQIFPEIGGWTLAISASAGDIEATSSAPFTTNAGDWGSVSGACSNDGVNFADLPALTLTTDANACDIIRSQVLNLSDWGFAIPDGVTIRAIVVRINCSCGNPGDPTEQISLSCNLGVIVGGDTTWLGQDIEGDTCSPLEFGGCGNCWQLDNNLNPIAAPGTEPPWLPSPDPYDAGHYTGLTYFDVENGGVSFVDPSVDNLANYIGDWPITPPTYPSIPQINDSGFGIACSFRGGGIDGLADFAEIQVYAVAIGIYYSTGGGSSVSGFAASDFIPSLAGFAGSISGGFGCSPGGSGAPVYDMQIPGQPTGENFVLDDNCSDWFVRARRTDEYGSSEWGFLYIPVEDIIQSGFLRGQGSVISVLDNQFDPLFTYTAASTALGGPNSGEVNITWPSFMLGYADTSLQNITGGAIDSGLTLDSSLTGPTTYNVFPKIQPWNGSVVEMDNPSGIPGGFCIPDGSPYLSVAGADTQKDGFVNLAGPPLAFQVIVPSASGGGSGGGGTGGSGCVVFGEKVYNTAGWIEVEKLKIGDLLQGADPFTGEETWNTVMSIKKSEAMSMEIVLKDGSRKKVSTSTPCAVKYGDEIRVITSSSVTISHSMFSRKTKSWVKVFEVSSIGEQPVVKIRLSPNSWMFVNDVLSHNTRTKG